MAGQSLPAAARAASALYYMLVQAAEACFSAGDISLGSVANSFVVEVAAYIVAWHRAIDVQAGQNNSRAKSKRH